MINENFEIFEAKKIKKLALQTIEENKQEGEILSFSELYEQSLHNISLKQIVIGKVIQINNDVVMVDVGFKIEGKIVSSELKDKNGNFIVSIGDELEVLVDHKNDEDNLILSYSKVKKIKAWDQIKSLYEQDQKIFGTICDKVKGGFIVEIINSINAFLPGSLLELNAIPIREIKNYLGKSFEFNIIHYDRKKSNIVLSRKKILQKQKDEKYKKLFSLLEEGKIITGIIKNITDYGIFIDLGGIDGLLHITDISWGKISKPITNFAKGEKIITKIISLDRSKNKISLGLKQLVKNPWDEIDKCYKVGNIIKGKVINIKDYGVFVEIKPGLEGLIHISEIFWVNKRFRHPSQKLNINEIIDVMILNIDSDKKKISLSLKKTQENPWLKIQEKFSIGTIIKGYIKNITKFGIFIGIENEIDGLVHISDISWEQKIKHPAEFFKKGQLIKAIVLNIDVTTEKFSLGIKQLEKNIFDIFLAKNNIGSKLIGTITKILHTGFLLTIEKGIEGFLHLDDCISSTNKKNKFYSPSYKKGDKLHIIIKSIDQKNKKINLKIFNKKKSSNLFFPKNYLNNKEKIGCNLSKALGNIKILP